MDSRVDCVIHAGYSLLPSANAPNQASGSGSMQNLVTRLNQKTGELKTQEKTAFEGGAADGFELMSISSMEESIFSKIKDLPWLKYVMVIWAVVALIMLAVMRTSLMMTVKRAYRSKVAVPGDLKDRFKTKANEVGLRRVPKLVVSSAVDSPFVIGFWRHMVFLNQGFDVDLNEDEQDLVIKHELIHIKRGDLKMNSFLCIALSMHWFNPLLHFALSLARIDRETACDSDVLVQASDKKRVAYGHTLIKMKTSKPQLFSSIAGIAFIGSQSGKERVKHRIQSIITKPKPKPKPNKIMKLLSITCITFLTLLGIANSSESDVKNTEPTKKNVLSEKSSDGMKNLMEEAMRINSIYVEIINNAPNVYSKEFVEELKNRVNNLTYTYNKSANVATLLSIKKDKGQSSMDIPSLGHFKTSAGIKKFMAGELKLKITLYSIDTSNSGRVGGKEGAEMVLFERYKYGNWAGKGKGWQRVRCVSSNLSETKPDKFVSKIINNTYFYSFMK